MKDSKKTLALKELLEQEGKKSEEIESTLNLVRTYEEGEKMDSLRSWIAVIISGLALLVSILVAVSK